MTDKERLVETMKNSLHRYIGEYYTLAENLADDILADGWIRPPCKVGQILYVIGLGIIHESKVKEYKYCSNSNNDVHWHIVFEERFTISEAHIGKIAFYAREEAEKALRGGESDA